MESIQDIFTEIDTHLLEDDRPSLYFNEISETPLFYKYPIGLLNKLKHTDQSPKHHPEGNVWNHTMLVLDEAAKVKSQSNDKRVFMWAALLHDIGKPDTTRYNKGKITSYDHDKAGAEIARKFLSEFTDEEIFIEKVAELIRWHMQILFVVNNLPFADIKTMKKKTDFNEVALLGLCDRLGRTGAERSEEERNINMFLQKMRI
jgi:putative nucleotidyltransferase with HDIG domain